MEASCLYGWLFRTPASPSMLGAAPAKTSPTLRTAAGPTAISPSGKAHGKKQGPRGNPVGLATLRSNDQGVLGLCAESKSIGDDDITQALVLGFSSTLVGQGNSHTSHSDHRCRSLLTGCARRVGNKEIHFCMNIAGAGGEKGYSTGE